MKELLRPFWSSESSESSSSSVAIAHKIEYLLNCEKACLIAFSILKLARSYKLKHD